MSRYAVCRAIGSCLPERVVSNKELEARIETSDEWIRSRTGITQRHIVDANEATSDLAARAAREALAKAGWSADSLDMILVATVSADETFPSAACRVQQKIGATKAFAFDLQAACAGFVYGLSTAEALLKAGRGTRALVIGAETFSRLVDWEDRATCILFGDGAGAMALELQESAEPVGILASHLASDGTLGDILKTSGGIGSTGRAGTVMMQGKEVFRHAVSRMIESLQVSLQAAGLQLEEIDWLVPHQANERIITAIAEKLNFPLEKVVVSVNRHANTSAASIPLALAQAEREGKLKPGQILAMPALGAGLTWGSCVIKL